MGRALSSVLGPLIGLAVVVLIFGVWKPDKFLSRGTLNLALLNNYHYAVAAVGMTFVIITAGIDLSVGSTMALSCVCCALAIRGLSFPPRDAGTTLTLALAAAILVCICVAARLLQQGTSYGRAFLVGLGWAGGAGVIVAVIWLLIAGRHWPPAPWPVAMLFGIAVGAAVGLLNGTLVTSLGLPPFVATLATLGAVRGLVLYICNDYPVSRDPEHWDPRAIANIDQMSRLYLGEFLGLAPNVWIALLVGAIAIPLLHFTVLGRYAYAIGSNERTARLCGVNVERYKTICYVIAGACAGLAGVMMTAQFKGGQPTEFSGAELIVIAAVVIGGTSLFGGEGTIVGTLLGILMLGLLYSGCVLADISSNVQRIFIGGTIILAATLDRFRHLRG
jgi:ribose/xylose/arabinose/galactoside ABC-type transport system permease subunit